MTDHRHSGKRDDGRKDVEAEAEELRLSDKSAYVVDADSLDDVWQDVLKQKDKKESGEQEEAVASELFQLPEPGAISWQDEQAFAATMEGQPLFQSLNAASTNRNSSMDVDQSPKERKAEMPSRKQHQAMEDGRTPPPLPSAFTMPQIPRPLLVNSSLFTIDESVTSLEAAIEAAKIDLFVTLRRSTDNTAPKTATLNLVTAQRLVLADYQRKITKTLHEVITTNDKRSAEEAVKLLNIQLYRYCKSLRNLEYMQEHAARRAKDDELDPFYLKSSKHLSRLAMEDAGLIPDLLLPKGLLPIARDHDSPQLPGLSRTVAHKASESEQLWVRFGMASAGGLVLIVPMLIMANLETKTASLITTCMAMFLFAAGITFGTRLKPDQVLGATAAYAAVLVVFVGTSFST